MLIIFFYDNKRNWQLVSCNEEEWNEGRSELFLLFVTMVVMLSSILMVYLELQEVFLNFILGKLLYCLIPLLSYTLVFGIILCLPNSNCSYLPALGRLIQQDSMSDQEGMLYLYLPIISLSWMIPCDS